MASNIEEDAEPQSHQSRSSGSRQRLTDTREATAEGVPGRKASLHNTPMMQEKGVSEGSKAPSQKAPSPTPSSKGTFEERSKTGHAMKRTPAQTGPCWEKFLGDLDDLGMRALADEFIGHMPPRRGSEEQQAQLTPRPMPARVRTDGDAVPVGDGGGGGGIGTAEGEKPPQRAGTLRQTVDYDLNRKLRTNAKPKCKGCRRDGTSFKICLELRHPQAFLASASDDDKALFVKKLGDRFPEGIIGLQEPVLVMRAGVGGVGPEHSGDPSDDCGEEDVRETESKSDSDENVPKTERVTESESDSDGNVPETERESDSDGNVPETESESGPDGYVAETERESDPGGEPAAKDWVSNSDLEWEADNPTQAERNRAFLHSGQHRLPPGTPRQAPEPSNPANGRNEWDAAGHFEPNEEAEVNGEAGQGDLPFGREGGSEDGLAGQVGTAHQLPGPRPPLEPHCRLHLNIGDRNGVLLGGQGSNEEGGMAESTSDWGPSVDSSYENEQAGEPVRTQGATASRRDDGQESDPHEEVDSGVGRYGDVAVGLTENERSGGATGQHDDVAEGPVDDSEATHDELPQDRRLLESVDAPSVGPATAAAAAAGGRDIPPPTSSETESDEHGGWRPTKPAARDRGSDEELPPGQPVVGESGQVEGTVTSDSTTEDERAIPHRDEGAGSEEPARDSQEVQGKHRGRKEQRAPVEKVQRKASGEGEEEAFVGGPEEIRLERNDKVDERPARATDDDMQTRRALVRVAEAAAGTAAGAEKERDSIHLRQIASTDKTDKERAPVCKREELSGESGNAGEQTDNGQGNAVVASVSGEAGVDAAQPLKSDSKEAKESLKAVEQLGALSTGGPHPEVGQTAAERTELVGSPADATDSDDDSDHGGFVLVPVGERAAAAAAREREQGPRDAPGKCEMGSSEGSKGGEGSPGVVTGDCRKESSDAEGYDSDRPIELLQRPQLNAALPKEMPRSAARDGKMDGAASDGSSSDAETEDEDGGDKGGAHSPSQPGQEMAGDVAGGRKAAEADSPLGASKGFAHVGGSRGADVPAQRSLSEEASESSEESGSKETAGQVLESRPVSAESDSAGEDASEADSSSKESAESDRAARGMSVEQAPADADADAQGSSESGEETGGKAESSEEEERTDGADVESESAKQTAENVDEEASESNNDESSQSGGASDAETSVAVQATSSKDETGSESESESQGMPRGPMGLAGTDVTQPVSTALQDSRSSLGASGAESESETEGEGRTGAARGRREEQSRGAPRSDQATDGVEGERSEDVSEGSDAELRERGVPKGETPEATAAPAKAAAKKVEEEGDDEDDSEEESDGEDDSDEESDGEDDSEEESNAEAEETPKTKVAAAKKTDTDEEASEYDDDDDDGDAEEDDEEEEQVPPQKAAVAVKAPAKNEESSEKEESDDDSEEEDPKKATAKPVAKAAAKPAAKAVPKPAPMDVDEESDESESEEDEKPKPATKATPAKVAGKKVEASGEDSSDEESEGDSSDDDEETPEVAATKVAVTKPGAKEESDEDDSDADESDDEPAPETAAAKPAAKTVDEESDDEDASDAEGTEESEDQAADEDDDDSGSGEESDGEPQIGPASKGVGQTGSGGRHVERKRGPADASSEEGESSDDDESSAGDSGEDEAPKQGSEHHPAVVKSESESEGESDSESEPADLPGQPHAGNSHEAGKTRVREATPETRTDSEAGHVGESRIADDSVSDESEEGTPEEDTSSSESRRSGSASAKRSRPAKLPSGATACEGAGLDSDSSSSGSSSGSSSDSSSSSSSDSGSGTDDDVPVAKGTASSVRRGGGPKASPAKPLADRLPNGRGREGLQTAKGAEQSASGGQDPSCSREVVAPAVPQVPGEAPLPNFSLLTLSHPLPPGAAPQDCLHALLAQLWKQQVKDGPALTLRIPAVNTKELARKPVRRFADLATYQSYFRLWVLLEAWETLRGEYTEVMRRFGSKKKAPRQVSHTSALLDVGGVSRPGDGFTYLELRSRGGAKSHLLDRDEVVVVEEVVFVDQSEPGFRGPAGNLERSGKSVLAFAHFSGGKDTVRVRGKYQPASKVVCLVRVCSLTTLLRSWGALSEMGSHAYSALLLDPSHWTPGAYGADLAPDQRAVKQPRVTDEFFWSPYDGRIFLHFLRTWHEKGLINSDQMEALAIGLLPQERLALIQGPPGTGKTATIVALVSALLAVSPTARILLCAPSNAAIDECTRRLLAGTMINKDGSLYTPDLQRILRVGPPPSVHSDCQKVTLDSHLDTRRGGFNYRGLGVRAAEDKMRDDVMSCARVVCATLSGSGMEWMVDKMPIFTAVIVDEAAQAVEPETLVALNRLSNQGRMILVGDACQLPATVMQYPKGPYDVSLFERLQVAGARCTLLATQYRMHPAIRHFPNTRFYGGQLQDAPSIAARPLIIGDSWATNCSSRDLLAVHSEGVQFHLGPYRFLDVRWSSEEHGEGGSTHNHLEASVVAAVVSGLIKAVADGLPVRGPEGLVEARHFKPGGAAWGDGDLFSVGVVTPYAAQKHLICRLLSEAGVPDNAYEVNTVDGFQGREMDAIVVSTVRTSKEGRRGPGGSIGFVSDPRRMNVALTRARHCLLIVGDASTLGERSHDWRLLIKDAKARNCFEEIQQNGKSPKKVRPWNGGGGSGLVPQEREDGPGGTKRKLELGEAGGELDGGGKRREGDGSGARLAADDSAPMDNGAKGSKVLERKAKKVGGTNGSDGEKATQPTERVRPQQTKGADDDADRGGSTGARATKKAKRQRAEGAAATSTVARPNKRKKNNGPPGADRTTEARVEPENGHRKRKKKAGTGTDKEAAPPSRAAALDEGAIAEGGKAQGKAPLGKNGGVEMEAKSNTAETEVGRIPRPILKRHSGVSKKGWKVGKKTRVGKHVKFQKDGRLEQVQYMPRGNKCDKDGPTEGDRGGKASRNGLTFQTFKDLKRKEKGGGSKAAPADGRLLQKDAVDGKAAGVEVTAEGPERGSEQGVVKPEVPRKVEKKKAKGQGTRKGH